MNWIKIVVTYAAAAVLSLWLWSEFTSRLPAEALDDSPDGPFIAALATRIDRVRIDRGEELVEFRRDAEGRWRLFEPAGIEAPSDIVDAVVDTLTTIGAIETVARDPGTDGEYGLNPPRLRLRLDADGEAVSTVSFGHRNPTRTAVYAKKAGENAVYLLGLNAQYYLDLALEHIDRERGLAAPPDVAATAGDPPGAPEGDPTDDPAAVPGD